MIITAKLFATLMRAVTARFVDDRCAQVASSLTFTTLLAIVPVITVALTVGSAFPGFESLIDSVRGFVVNNLLPQSANAIANYTDQFAENAARLTTVGIAILGVTAILLMFTMERAFNTIWRVSRLRGLVQRILIYWAVLTVGPLLIGASLSLTSYLITLSLGLINHPPAVAVLVIKITSFALTACALALLYYTVPNRAIHRRDALIGGVAGGICLEAVKQGFGFYLAYIPSYTLVYGTFAAVPIFLLWIYCSWLIILGGAVLVAVLPEWRARHETLPRVPGSDLFDVIQILDVFFRAHHKGEIVTLARLQPVVLATFENLEVMLDALVEAGWIACAHPEGWVLRRDASSIRIYDVYRLFVLRADIGVPARQADPVLDTLIHELTTHHAGIMSMSLEQIFRRAEQGFPARDANAGDQAT
jgi:membrane protein